MIMDLILSKEKPVWIKPVSELNKLYLYKGVSERLCDEWDTRTKDSERASTGAGRGHHRQVVGGEEVEAVVAPSHRPVAPQDGGQQLLPAAHHLTQLRPYGL